MVEITTILKMHEEGTSISAIAKKIGRSRGMVRKYIQVYTGIDALKTISPENAFWYGLLALNPCIWSSKKIDSHVKEKKIVIENSGRTFLEKIGVIELVTAEKYIDKKQCRLQCKYKDDTDRLEGKIEKLQNKIKSSKSDLCSDADLKIANRKIDQHNSDVNAFEQKIKLLQDDLDKQIEKTRSWLADDYKGIVADARMRKVGIWFLSCACLSFTDDHLSTKSNYFVVRVVDREGGNCHFRLFKAGKSSTKIENFIKEFAKESIMHPNGKVLLIVLEDDVKCWRALNSSYCEGNVEVITPFADRNARKAWQKHVEQLTPKRRAIKNVEEIMKIVNEVKGWENLAENEIDDAVIDVAEKHELTVKRLKKLVLDAQNNALTEIKRINV